MAKKTFYSLIAVIIISFVFTMLIKFYRPKSDGAVSFKAFPMQIGEWQGVPEDVTPDVLAILNPQEIISATYTHPSGMKIHLLFDYFSPDGGFGGPHSPRNCLPGSGWSIEQVVDNPIKGFNRTIPAGRFSLLRSGDAMLMDFWYITHFGETASDYQFKLYELLSALTFKPRDVAFVRFVTADSEMNREMLADFQKQILPYIYEFLPFE